MSTRFMSTVESSGEHTHHDTLFAALVAANVDGGLVFQDGVFVAFFNSYTKKMSVTKDAPDYLARTLGVEAPVPSRNGYWR